MGECIVVRGLEVRFRGCDALLGADLTVNKGTVFALLGENGAGKTTLIRCLTGFQAYGAGTCQVLGLDPIKDALELRRRIGYVSDAPALYDWMRVDEIGWFASSFYPDGYLERYRELTAQYELPMDRKIRHLSKGQRAKVALSLAVSHDPELLILDEPTSGLDPLVRREFLESMVERAASGQTVLLSSHQISEVERVADEIAILHRGQFKLSSPLADLREAVFEVTLSVSDPLSVLPSISDGADILLEKKEGRQVRWIVRGFQDSHEQMLSGWPGVLAVRVRPATLEEVFVACTRGIEIHASEPIRSKGSVDKNDRQAS